MTAPETPKRSKHDCKLCGDDDDQILVSVSPREFSPASTREGRTYMEIRNENPFPICFRTSTSNRQRLSTQPESGSIPPHSKATIAVNFHVSAAVPTRRHEEVLVFSSPKPFVPPDVRSQDAFSHRHHQQCQHHECLHSSCTKEHHLTHDEKLKACRECQRHLKRFEEGFEEICPSSSDLFHAFHLKEGDNSERECTRVKRPHQCHLNYHSLKRTDGDLKGKSKPTKNDHFRRSLHTSCFKDSGEKGHRKPELEEVCLHSFVHRVSGHTGCRCDNCFRLTSLQETKIKSVVDTVVGVEAETTGHQHQGPRAQAVHTTHRDKQDPKIKQSIREAKVLAREKEPHVVARVVNCEDTLSNTDVLSDGSCWWDGKRYVVITEEMFGKKFKKAIKKEKKRQKQEVEDESSASEIDCCQKNTGTKTNKIRGLECVRNWTLSAIEQKCSRLIQLSWANLILSLILLLILIVCKAFCGEITRKPESTASIWAYFSWGLTFQQTC